MRTHRPIRRYLAGTWTSGGGHVGPDTGSSGFTPAQVDLLGGHSLRSGLVTEALRAGADAYSIIRQTGHRDPKMLAVS